MVTLLPRCSESKAWNLPADHAHEVGACADLSASDHSPDDATSSQRRPGPLRSQCRGSVLLESSRTSTVGRAGLSLTAKSARTWRRSGWPGELSEAASSA
mmetsp:Transcript_82555/g.223675  ORF Transcript_82555/g.223675 Transcript_82555/m.223675 type:complete len:100 (-) Transcript_82555:52-351(-)